MILSERWKKISGSKYRLNYIVFIILHITIVYNIFFINYGI